MFTMMCSVTVFWLLPSLLNTLATTKHRLRLHCFVPIFATLNPHVKVVTLICHDTILYYIAQRKKKVHTITTGSNQTLTADIRIFSVKEIS